jgi:hypothetical protein
VDPDVVIATIEPLYRQGQSARSPRPALQALNVMWRDQLALGRVDAGAARQGQAGLHARKTELQERVVLVKVELSYSWSMIASCGPLTTVTVADGPQSTILASAAGGPCHAKRGHEASSDVVAAGPGQTMRAVMRSRRL